MSHRTRGSVGQGAMSHRTRGSVGQGAMSHRTRGSVGQEAMSHRTRGSVGQGAMSHRTRGSVGQGAMSHRTRGSVGEGPCPSRSSDQAGAELHETSCPRATHSVAPYIPSLIGQLYVGFKPTAHAAKRRYCYRRLAWQHMLAILSGFLQACWVETTILRRD
jgi:hypothetical protein